MISARWDNDIVRYERCALTVTVMARSTFLIEANLTEVVCLLVVGLNTTFECFEVLVILLLLI